MMHRVVQRHRRIACKLLLALLVVISTSWKDIEGDDGSSPSADELEHEFKRIFAEEPTVDAPLIIARTYGSLAIPSLEALIERSDARRSPSLQLAALTTVALLSDDKDGYAVMERRAEKARTEWYLSMTRMPPQPRDRLLWDIFVRNVGVQDADAQAKASAMVVPIVELGSVDRRKALADKGKNSWNAQLRSSIERAISERERIEQLSDAALSDVISWNRILYSGWIASMDLRSRSAGSASNATRVFSITYCVARSGKSQLGRSNFVDAFHRYCSEVTTQQALRDTPRLVAIVLDQVRPEELRKAAIAVLVEAHKIAANLRGPFVSGLPEPLVWAADSTAALDELSRRGDGAVRRWIGEAILSDDTHRRQFDEIMKRLSIDEALSESLRKKSGDYARRPD